MSITPVGQQIEALSALESWWRKRQANKAERPFFALYGFAGTGKTSLAKFFLDSLGLSPNEVGFMTFTGKASRVVTERTGFQSNTIHSQIYKLVSTNRGYEWIRREDAPCAGLSVIVLDEVSQIGPVMFQDLLSFGVPLILLGDPFQLPPIGDKDMINQTPADYFLTEVHRQALDNPIIYWSQEIRQGRNIPFGKHGTVQKMPRDQLPVDQFLSADQTICGMNTTRTFLNRWYRQERGYTSPIPVAGEKLICLKNQRRAGLLNGLMARATADAVEMGNPHTLKMDMFIEDTEVYLEDQLTLRDHFQSVLDPSGQLTLLDRDGFPSHFTPFERSKTAQFTYGYTITGHKAQGSQYNKVVLVDEWNRDDRARWLYTCVTRAIEKLTILA